MVGRVQPRSCYSGTPPGSPRPRLAPISHLRTSAIVRRPGNASHVITGKPQGLPRPQLASITSQLTSVNMSQAIATMHVFMGCLWAPRPQLAIHPHQRRQPSLRSATMSHGFGPLNRILLTSHPTQLRLEYSSQVTCLPKQPG